MGLETIAAVALAASLGGQVASGLGQQSAQKKGLRAQGEAQASQLAAARRTEAQNAQDIAAANRKPPDLTTILARAQQLSKPSTMLTGPSGVKPTLLGQ